MFLWVALGAGVTDADEILDLLAEHRVVVVPGELRWLYTPSYSLPSSAATALRGWWLFGPSCAGHGVIRDLQRLMLV